MTAGAPVERHGRFAPGRRESPLRRGIDVIRRVVSAVKEDKIALVAAAVAFYGVLALFPGLTALVSVYGLIADPVDVERQLEAAGAVLPAEMQALLSSQLDRLVRTPARSLSLGLLVSLAVLLWSASRGTRALISAVNIAYNQEQRRGYIRQRALAVLMALGLMVVGILAVALVAVLPIVLGWLRLGELTDTLVRLGRWVLLAFLAILTASALYRHAPERPRQGFRWISWGGVLATGTWLLVSVLFSVYVESFGRFNETYGALASVVVLMLWMYLSAFAILVGAELDAELEARRRGERTARERQGAGEGKRPPDGGATRRA